MMCMFSPILCHSLCLTGDLFPQLHHLVHSAAMGAAVGNGATWKHVEFLDTGRFNFFLSLRRLIRRTRKNDVCLRMHLGVFPGFSDSFSQLFISDEEH